jgi:protein-S-isoprenylcysteine O-methyltransferase
MGAFDDLWRSARVSAMSEIALTGFLLGFAGCFSLTCIASHLFWGSSVWVYTFGCYLFTVFAVFHMAEFIVAAEYRPHDATPRSFMILHSPAFLVANGVAWFEFLVCGWWLQLAYHPEPSAWFTTLATMVALAFYSVRLAAMVQCGSNFSLQIETSRRSTHRLVKHGVYSVFRHPSYFGWFWYCVTTQFIVLNPLCMVLFPCAAWYFFYKRIREEEHILGSKDFFGSDYETYKKTTHIGIPFI